MARAIHKRIKIKGTLTAQTPLHVGGLGTDPTVDLSLAVNGENRHYIPGTSLAGALRNWMTDYGFNVDAIWGFQKADQGHASFIIIDDAEVTLPKGAIAELRDHVGIDRLYGAASDKTKFDRAILPKGSSFPLKMTIDLASGNNQDHASHQAVEQLIHALEQGEVRLGGAKTRGLGLIKLTGREWQEYDFSSFAGMIAALEKKGTPRKPTATVCSHLLHLSIHWQPVGALMVKSGQDGVAVDILPLVSRDRDKVAFVLPGSAVKGVLRSQAERILRTVLQQDCPKDKLQHQLEADSLELTQWLFGKAGTGDKAETTSFGRGALMVDDCYCQKKLDPKQWQAVEQAIDDPKNPNTGTLRGSLDAALLTDTQQAFHVAIDRWTGGAAEHMLYSALEPFNLDWEPIKLTLDLHRIEAPQREAVQALLILTLRDLASGRIPLGYGVNRGYGSLKVTEITCQSPALREFHERTITFSRQGAIAGIDLAPLNQAWQTWLQQAQISEVNA